MFVSVKDTSLTCLAALAKSSDVSDTVYPCNVIFWWSVRKATRPRGRINSF